MRLTSSIFCCYAAKGDGAEGEILIDRLSRLFRVERGEWPKLLQFGLLGFLLQMGMGIGFSAGDAAFLSHVGADALPIVFILTPLVMLVYTGLFSVLMVRFRLDHLVMMTLGLLAAGGLLFWLLLGGGGEEKPLYYALKLYLAMWYIALYSLFWNYTDAYFDIQDAKRLFPLFAAFCALGTAAGALVVNLLAATLSLSSFLLLWSALALATIPLARLLGRRWRQIAESDADAGEGAEGAGAQLAMLFGSFRTSRYTVVLTATLFVTLLMTNLAEYQYATVLQEGRSEAELAALFGALYAASNIFNLIVCLFVFNRLVSRLGVRNVAFILPLTYFAVFGFFFLSGGYAAAIAAFFAYHAVLTSIEYNNQNLLFNAVPSAIKRPLRTVVEGMCEPLASLIAGGFLVYAVKYLDLRELSGIGVILGVALIVIVALLRGLYPAAMAGNMRRGWLDFSAPLPARMPEAEARLRAVAADPAAPLARQATELIAALAPNAASGHADGIDAIPALLASAQARTPRDRRALVDRLKDFGETAIPHLVAALRDGRRAYAERALAARALAGLSFAQFAAQADGLVKAELGAARRWADNATRLAAAAGADAAVGLLGRAQRERAEAAVDFVLELLALRGLLPDFDLLIVSLHSANAKVRANAMEAIEAGVGYRLYAEIAAATQVEANRAEAPTANEIVALVDGVLDNGGPVEVAAALDILFARLPAADFARRSRRLLGPGMPEPLRRQLLDRLGILHENGPGLVALIDALHRIPGFAAATSQALADLARSATLHEPKEPAFGGMANRRPFWIAHHAITEAASRHPDLALVMLRIQDGRAHAA
ncbi:MFS transporter [Sphingopyxis sp.]|uniref:MFS transporter n=1 Tax=Sphingopyxis sp. TaxID=1908224 RepID=UPI003D0A9113